MENTKPLESLNRSSKNFGNYDIYFWNFVVLMFFTLFEVARCLF